MHCLLFLTFLCQTAFPQIQDKYAEWGPTSRRSMTGVIVRGGYVIGGTTPVPVPGEIRGIEAFHPIGGVTVGADAYHQFSRRWAVQLGLHVFYEGFHTQATVKNYRMAIRQGLDYLEGHFTGTDVTDTWMVGLTIPLTAAFDISPRWRVSAGPFVSFLFDKAFEGEAYDGYLREGNPTGQKVEISTENRATYDFRENMNSKYWGVEVVFDWKAMRHMNVFGGIDWACSSIFPSSFHTVEFKMMPIYAKLGFAYRY